MIRILASFVIEGRISAADRALTAEGDLEIGAVSLQDLVAAYGSNETEDADPQPESSLEASSSKAARS